MQLIRFIISINFEQIFNFSVIPFTTYLKQLSFFTTLHRFFRLTALVSFYLIIPKERSTERNKRYICRTKAKRSGNTASITAAPWQIDCVTLNVIANSIFNRHTLNEIKKLIKSRFCKLAVLYPAVTPGLSGTYNRMLTHPVFIKSNKRVALPTLYYQGYLFVSCPTE